MVVCERRGEIGNSVAKHLYGAGKGGTRPGLHVTETLNRIELAVTVFERIGGLSGGIDLIHVSFDGLASLGCCEYALDHGIPYVLELSPDKGKRGFAAEWEKRYFEWFAKHSLVTLVPDIGLELSDDLPMTSVGRSDRSDDSLFGEILSKTKTVSPSSKPDFTDLLQCGDSRCLANLHDALDRMEGIGDSTRLSSFGGQGLIYTTFSRRLQKTVVVKIPNYPRRSPDRYPTMERTLLKEAKLFARCNALGTKYVPMLHGADSSGRYVVRDFVDGRCLSEVLKSMPPDSGPALQILGDFVAMTEELFHVFHDLLGVVIKDYKPRNIILTETDAGREYKLVDLGSCLKESDIPFKSTNNLAKLGGGDFLYWAPEVLLGEFDKCDRRLDYFSFGVTCFRIITGEHPYSNSGSAPERVRDNYEREYGIAVGKLENSDLTRTVETRLLRFIVDSLNPDCSKRPGRWFRPQMEDRKNYLERLHSETRERIGCDHRMICKVAADKPAFILSSYCSWLVAQCQALNIGRLYFLSRDGFILKKITEVFVRKLGLDIRCAYLYASRQSSRIIGIKTIDSAVLKWLTKKPKGGTVTAGLVLKRLSLDNDSEVGTMLEEFGMTAETADAVKISALLEDERMHARILAHVRREKGIALRYFKESGLTDDSSGRFALVDIGWQGRIPLAIKETLGLRQLAIFYFGSLKPEDNSALDMRAWLFDNHVRADWFTFFDDTIATDFVEIMATADHKTLLHYGELLDAPPENAKDDDLASWGVSEYHRAILAYADALSPEEVKRLDCIEDRELVFQKIKELTLSPSFAERAVFGAYPYCPEQTDSLKRPFGTMLATTQPSPPTPHSDSYPDGFASARNPTK